MSDKNQNNQSRPPIVAVLGHVDHGKTTLLDVIRKTHVASREAGGITQSIGASIITTKEGKKITFIDTPGHAAFTKMRSRGASVSDLVILVVGADDGVKPQTKEALEIILKAQIPFIVAITKIDLPSADKEAVRNQLEKEGALFEGRGGDTPLVAVSAKQQKGIEELLEMIILLAEVTEIKADPQADLEAVVIETSKDKRGLLVSAVVRNGTLKVGDTVFIGELENRIRGLFDESGKSVAAVGPGEPCQILGFGQLPPVGSQISTEKKAKILNKQPEEKVYQAKKIQKGQIPILLKVKSAGTMEAVLAHIPEGIVIVDNSVGDVNESDVLMAKAAGAKIFAFESKIPNSVGKLAVTEAVKVLRFEIIYELIEKLEKMLEGEKEEVLGKAEILASFPFNDKKVAGCKVVQGRVAKADKLILMRGEKEIGIMKATSLKKQKTEITEAKTGEEFGVIFEPQLDFEIGDMLLSVTK